MNVTPDYQHRLLENTESGNFALVFSRMTQWNLSGHEPKPEFQSGTRRTRNGPVPVYDSAIVQLGRRANSILPHAALVLQQVHQRQKRLLEEAHNMDAFALEIRAHLTSPFISGLGSGHPTETGMILDRNTGIPYIPASAIKGVLRLAHSINLLRSGRAGQWVRKGIMDRKGRFKPDPNGDHLNLEDREPSLRKYFGDTDTSAADAMRGQLVFLDAFPKTPPTLKTDIMNPHYQKYYGGNGPPEDCHDPIPVKFLAVQEGTVFVFRVLAKPLASPQDRPESEGTNTVERSFGPDDEKHVRNMFTVAFEELGFGGKTSVGYGRFEWLASGSPKPIPGMNAPPSTDPPTTMATLKENEEAKRRGAVEDFKKALPQADALSGQIDNLIQKIRAKDDERTRQACCHLLLDLAQSNKKAFKKAIKGRKPWVVKILNFCKEMGVELRTS
jgi:CRISPR-associated protein Cmr6